MNGRAIFSVFVIKFFPLLGLARTPCLRLIAGSIHAMYSLLHKASRVSF